MGALERMQKAKELEFRTRIEGVLYYAAVMVLSSDSGTYTDQRVAAAKKIVNGQVGIDEFAKCMVNDAELGPLIDAGEPISEAQLFAAAVATVGVLAKAVY